MGLLRLVGSMGLLRLAGSMGLLRLAGSMGLLRHVGSMGRRLIYGSCTGLQWAVDGPIMEIIRFIG